MTDIIYQEMTITCEGCRAVQKFKVTAYEECLEIFNDFQCPEGCGRNLYSFLTVGKMKKTPRPVLFT